MRNAEIALAFDELADLYELDGAGRAQEISGVGKTIAEKIDALLETGSIPSARKLKDKYPPGLVEVTRIPGLGPKRTRRLFDELDVSSLDDLRKAVEDERIRGLQGFGEKAEENIRIALDAGADGRPQPRTLLSNALRIAEGLRDALREHPAAGRVEIAGSARRWTDTCKDLDLVATASDPGALAKAFTE